MIVAASSPLEYNFYLRVGKPYPFFVALARGDLANCFRSEALLAGLKQQRRRISDLVLTSESNGVIGHVPGECDKP
ncbi:hypothetical protein D3C81_2063100 [compost metagenome]